MTAKVLRLAPGLNVPAEEFVESATALIGKRGAGKALSLLTPIPTPLGWTTMDKVRAGDKVFGADGKPTTVVWASEVMMGHRCFSVRFDDGSEVIADAGHLWLSETLAYRRTLSVRRWKADKRGGPPNLDWSRDRPQCRPSLSPSIVTTEEMALTLGVTYSSGRMDANHSIPCAGPLETPETTLPLDPYVLGVWLGDGTTKTFDVTTMDPEVIEGISHAGFQTVRYAWGCDGLAATYGVREPDGPKATHILSSVGVLRNKHIPDVYLRASIAQRLELLKGLMDTDGYASARGGDVEFYSTNKKLANGAFELVVSLGWKARFRSKPAKLYGKDCGTCYVVAFRPDRQVFHVRRKGDRLRFDRSQQSRHRRRVVVAVEEVASEPVKCIRVGASDGMFLVGRSMVPTHNSGGVKVIEEELFRVGLPFITLDPIGIHYGIRSSFDGKSPGLPVLIIGGEYGDVKLDRHGGAAVARAIIEANVSCVIDFSEEPKSVYRMFVRDFAHELFRKNESSRVVILEEASELIPQRLRPDMAETYEAVERLVSRGRNKGLGVVLVDQRAAKVNKDVLCEVDNLFVGRLIGTPDRKQLGAWVEAWDVGERFGEFMSKLASLPTRTMWLWSPETLKKFEPIRFKDFKTLHADKTHMRRMGISVSRPVTTDVSSVVAKLGTEMEKLAKEKEETARLPVLKRENERLVAEVQRLRARPPEKVAAVSPGADVGTLKAEVARLASVNRDLHKVLSLATHSLKRAKAIAEKVSDAAGDIGALEDPTEPKVVVTLSPELKREFSGPSKTNVPEPVPPVRTLYPDDLVPRGVERREGDGHLYAGQVKMLKEVVRATAMGNVLNRVQLGTLSGYSPRSSTFKTYLGALKRGGLVEDNGGGLRATDAGKERSGPSNDLPSTPSELRVMWEAKLYAGEAKMLRAIVEMGKDGLDRDQLSQLTGYSQSSSTFKTYLGHLRRLQIVTEYGGVLHAVPELW